MRLKEEDLIAFAKLFKDLCNGKYKVAVISSDEEEYLYDLSNPTEDGFDDLVQKTLMASINNVLIDRTLKKASAVPLVNPKPEPFREFKPHDNPYLWSFQTKKLQ